MPWANADLVLYHGTESDQLRSIGLKPNPHGLSLARCRTATDFGQGFYMTTSEHQAKQWANIKQEDASNPNAQAVVIRFEIERNTLASLQSLVFIVDNPDYWNFVKFCRKGSPPHGRRPSSPAEYEVVYGPLAMYKQILVLKDCDQVSFHTQNALNQLPSPELHVRGNPRF